MDHFYVTLPSDSSGNYFPHNTMANFRTNLATPIEVEDEKWEVGLVETTYPKGYKKRVQNNTVRLDSTNIKFPVKHYNTLHELVTHLARHYKSSNKREELMKAYSECLNSYLFPTGVTNELSRSDYGHNSVQITDNLVSHFPVRLYKGIEPVYVYTDVIKPNLVGDSYVRLLTSLHFPSGTGYHRFHYALYKPVEQSFIESISIRLITKTSEDVVFEDSDIPFLVTLHFKKKYAVH
jgi:hypothetical protein